MSLPLFSKLLSKRLTRKEFLTYLGLLVLTISGISGLLRTLSNPQLAEFERKASKTNRPYGDGPYGV